MPNTLILRMPPPGSEETEWLVVDDTGTRTGPRQRGPLSLAAAVAQNHRLVVLVPATEVMLAEPDLPPGSGAKLARAVPFALEEHLTEDVDTLHFAIGRRGSGSSTPVAVVTREVLRGWLSRLNDAGLHPQAIHVDVSLMPDNPGQTILWVEGSRLSVRRAGKPGFSVEVDPVEEALAIAGVIRDPLTATMTADAGAETDVIAEPPVPESALLFVTQEDWARVQDDFDRLIDRFEALKVQLLPEGPLVWLARELPSAGAINLLQGEFAQQEQYGSHWRRWRVAAFLCVGLLVTHLAAEALSLHQAKKQSAALQNSIDQIVATALPGERPVDARRQMQARLSQIRGNGAGPDYFLRTLQSLSGAIGSRPNTSVDALSFRESTLDLKLTAPSVDDLAALSQVIQQQGLQAEILSSTPAAHGIDGRMQIRAPSTGAAVPK